MNMVSAAPVIIHPSRQRFAATAVESAAKASVQLLRLVIEGEAEDARVFRKSIRLLAHATSDAIMVPGLDDGTEVVTMRLFAALAQYLDATAS